MDGSMHEGNDQEGSKRGTGVFLGGRYSKEEIIAYGGIPESAVMGVRTSARVQAQPNTDATQLERAQQQAQTRDDILYSGTKIPSRFTIASIPNHEVVSRASKLGISLGLSPSNISASVNIIKDLDLQRTLVILKQKEYTASKESNDSTSFVMNDVSRLSNDLVDEEQDTLKDHKDPPSKPTRVYRRRGTDVSVVLV
jgi:hypothetical protein